MTTHKNCKQCGLLLSTLNHFGNTWEGKNTKIDEMGARDFRDTCLVCESGVSRYEEPKTRQESHHER